VLSLPVEAPPFIDNPTVYNETENVEIICRSNAVPVPLRTSWERNDVTVSSLGLLNITSIQRNDAGIYTCCTLRLVAGEPVITCGNFTITVQCEFFIL